LGGFALPVAADEEQLGSTMFGFLPQPAYMPCDECGVSLREEARDEHVCSNHSRVEYQLCQLRGEVEAFDDQLAAYLESPRGRFELWYAERERRR
jgi:hypothetical protein